MGFCFLNNVAIAATYAMAKYKLTRVAIVDFDVHHGNGTEDALAGDERVLMCSFFSILSFQIAAPTTLLRICRIFRSMLTPKGRRFGI